MTTPDLDIRHTVDAYCLGVNTLDEALIRGMWARHHDVSFLHPRGHSVGIDAIWSEFYRDTMFLFSSRNLQVASITTHSLGNVAWVEFYWVFDSIFAHDGSDLHTEGRETQLMVNEHDHWRLVHIHYSTMPITGEREGF